MIATRELGRTGARVSILGMGGHHLGEAKGYEEAERMVHDAVDAGITFFDNCWEYHNGMSEVWMGRALASGGGARRQKAFLMTKVCTHGRDGKLALQMLDESLRRLQTDHLDLWQVHGVSFDNDPDLAFRKGGVVEALDAAKRAGKVRFVGFTGHKDPHIHLGMLAHKYPFDTVQMPLNCFDATFRSFEQLVLPELQRQGIAALGMKPLGGLAGAVKKGLVSAAEMMRYAMSLPVAVTISGMDSPDVLKKNLALAETHKPMTPAEMTALRERCRETAGDGRFELYKVSLKYDNPNARLPHGFPTDPKQKEVEEQLHEVMPP
jgi:aryl-alcohol dehydrogenase-like predicted oxidoreductase